MARKYYTALSADLLKAIAIAIATTLALCLSALPLMSFMDRANYVIYLQSSGAIFINYGLKVVTNEPVWLATAHALGSVAGPEWGLRLIIGGSAIATAYAVLSLTAPKIFYPTLLLLTPFMLVNHIVHLRQGLASAVFMTGLLIGGRAKIVIWLITPFIHSGFTVVLAVIGCWKLLRWARCSLDTTVILHLTLMAILGLAIPLVADFLGARQADLYQADAVGSGTGFWFWGLVLLMTLAACRGKTPAGHQELGIAIMSFYVAAYWTFPAVARILEASFPMIIITLVSSANSRINLPAILVMVFGGLTYWRMSSMPMLGFGGV